MKHSSRPALFLLSARDSEPIRAMQEDLLLTSLRRQHPAGRIWNLNFGIAAGFNGIDGGRNPVEVKPNLCPLGGLGQYQNCNGPTRKVLLIAHVPISCEQKVKPRFLCRPEQKSVDQSLPALSLGRRDAVLRKRIH